MEGRVGTLLGLFVGLVRGILLQLCFSSNVLLIPSFRTLTLPSYLDLRNHPKPCVFSLKLHSVIDAPNNINSGSCFGDAILL